MEIESLHAELVQSKIRHFYVFTGSEIEVQNIYVNKIAKLAELQLCRVDTVAEVVARVQRTSFLRQNSCFVVRHDASFLTQDKAWNAVIEMLGNNVLVLLYTKIDKRSVFYKTYKAVICEFDVLPMNTLIKRIRNSVDMSVKNAEYLAEMCECDFGRILLECDKIRRYAEETALDADESFKQLVIDGTIFSPPEDMAFKWVDAVLLGNVIDAWWLLDECKQYGCAPLAMISLLYTSAKHVLQVQSCCSSDVSKSTGLTSYQVKCAKKRAGALSSAQLLEMMKLLHGAEMDIKTGKIDSAVAVDVVILNFFKNF